MKRIIPDGRTMHLADITEPIADHDYQCKWNPEHTIKAGRVYVRVVYRMKGDKAKPPECHHYCVDCWTGPMNED